MAYETDEVHILYRGEILLSFCRKAGGERIEINLNERIPIAKTRHGHYIIIPEVSAGEQRMLKLSGVAKAGQHYLQHLTGNVQLATFIGLIKKLEKENLND